jgi:hypothetical protein
MMDVHRCKTALVVMCIPERELLGAMRRAEGIVDIKDLQLAWFHSRAELIEQSRGEPRRFVGCHQVRIANVAVGARSGTVRLGVGGDASGLFHASASAFEEVTIVPIAQVLNELPQIDLINVEGAEYEILDSILDLQLQHRLGDIQIQFHSVVPEAEARREAIRRQLERTHQLTYDFPFVWESWRRRLSE